MKYCWCVSLTALVASTILSSCSLPDADRLDKEANAQILQILERQKGRWDGEALHQTMDPNAKVAIADTTSICDFYSSALGPLKDVGPLRRVNFRSGVGINIPEYIGAYTADVSCAKAKGTASVSLHKRAGKWYLLAFNVNSPAIQNALGAEQKAASTFVDQFVPSLCRTWNFEKLEANADSDLKSELKNNSLQSKTLLAVSSKGLGKLEKYNGAKFTNFTSVEGRKVYAFAASAVFANGKAIIPITVSREADEWKVRSINFNAGPK
ncbi:MAG: hypothetical protein K2W95_08725 [Candidatus Obscuribacterales bacterium]|nr:hypothetical protein [Candidatus Obscuribacterales bacterium]